MIREQGVAVDYPSDVVDQIVRLYCESGLSTYRIGQTLGVNRQRVTLILRREGVAVAPNGAGRSRPLRVEGVITRDELDFLYTVQRLSSVEIGRTFGLSDRFVRSRLKLWGIERRSKGGLNRYDRHEVDSEDLSRLYLEKEWAASVVGDELGTSGGIVLRSAHSSGLPVRAGGSPRPSPMYDIQLIDALYDDIDVARALNSCNVKVVREPGPIWVRFPTPVELTEDLLTALYCGCGLAGFHIELLTGAPTSTVLRRLEEYGIDRRGRGGRSPFMRRWHSNQPRSATEHRPDQPCV